MHREHNPGDDDMAKEPTKYKNRLKKGGRIPWWHKLIDDKTKDNHTKDTVRNDEKDVNPNLKADRFRQRSSGHGAQGLNSTHTTRAWGPNEETINERQTSSRMNLAGLNKEGDLHAGQKRKPRHKEPRDKWNLIGRN